MKKHRIQIDALLLNNFPLMFKILTVIDTYVLFSNIRGLFHIDSEIVNERMKINIKNPELLDGYIILAEQLFTENMYKAISGDITNVNQIEWPNYVIIQKLFREKYIVTNADELTNFTITDIFNADNDLRYDIEDKDSMGPILNSDKIFEDYKNADLELDTMDNMFIAHNTDESANLEGLINQYKLTEKTALEYDAWMFE
jgi:hypothetical protein